MAVNDPTYKKFSEQILAKVHEVAKEKFNEWFPDFVKSDDGDEEEEKTQEIKNIQSFMNVSEMNMGLSVNTKFVEISVGSKFDHDKKDSSDLSDKFPTGTYLDVCFELDRIKLDGRLFQWHGCLFTWFWWWWFPSNTGRL